jgi:hypothetical protein
MEHDHYNTGVAHLSTPAMTLAPVLLSPGSLWHTCFCNTPGVRGGEGVSTTWERKRH